MYTLVSILTIIAALLLIVVVLVQKSKGGGLSSSFGGGMGRLREVCGAVSGMVAVLSAVEGYNDPTDNDAKMELYKKIQTLMGKFKEVNGSYICHELLSLPEGPSSPTPEKRTEAYYKKRPCAELVGSACEILDNYFNGK